ncbi:hypothetical protein EA658_16620 [Pseudoxanthomonas winnipegensis]|uniref:Lysozyme n=1 Tax=Pseudoxanthomonas winnipegensis TaxID=2480810 RepID=A0ABY1WCK0_9GAMM|nr:hypothetical protein [Pseudoxanthomonas winnipegensis]TAA11287.1 hypothetical protein EA659_08035 [Pseudoxanthomonas winnipegensis]TAA18710.1 hypothetical protein EA658_16620 [Pseudoxanthomonas winnipegensis]TAH73914.1 hypothetical protein EA657_00125 [Pseudoxanthomonas winnipegensis]
MSIDQAKAINRTAITPALQLLPARMDTPQARVELLAISGQEADFRHRWQVIDPARPEVRGPARGLWEFERGGGVRGVLGHPQSALAAKTLCRARGVAVDESAVYEALAGDDVLAAGFARLLLWTDPSALPAVGDVDGAWQLYLRVWRPGAYTRGTPAQRGRLRGKWAGYYATAREALAKEG